MQGTMEDYPANFVLSQFECFLHDFVVITKSDMKRILDKMKNLNHKVSATNYLQMKRKDIIGDTALHMAALYKKSVAFGVLLDLGAAFTMKNNSNVTALHKVIAGNKNLFLKKHTLDDTFVHLVLSAHLKSSNFENPSNDSGLSHFHIACAADNVELVKGFLCSGIVIDHAVKADSSLFPGFTPLHFAAKYCAHDVAELLLSAGANMRLKDAKGMTPLVLALESRLKIFGDENSDDALRNRNEKILKLLLEKESNNDVLFIDDCGLSHLHVACILTDTKIAERLLQKVVNINHSLNVESPLWPGYTPLHFAALCNIDNVKLLMKKGADISIKDTKGLTAFDMCVEKYKVEDIYSILSLHPTWKNIILLNSKTKLIDLVFAMNNSNQLSTFLKKHSKNCSVADSPLWPGYSPMHLAVLFGKVSETSETDCEDIKFPILRNLYKKNHKTLHSQDAHGCTPLHLAFLLNKKPVVDLLLEILNKTRSKVPDLVNEDGLSYVHIASAENNVPLLKKMLSIGSDVNAIYKKTTSFLPKIYSGSTPLHFAVVHGSVEVAEILMNQGADVYAKDVNGMTPIHLLMMNSNADILLSSPNLKDSVVNGIGLSHLHVAARCDKPETVKQLLDNGANINSVIRYKPNTNMQNDDDGLLFLKEYDSFSPLAIAYYEDYSTTMTALLERGADIFVESKEGKPLLYEVIEEGKIATNLDVFLDAIEESEDRQTILKANTGMNALHIACFIDDEEAIEKLLREGADVNEQIRADSPIFQGYTPLHITSFVSGIYDVEESVMLLVKKGAGITLCNAASETAIHMVYEVFDDTPGQMYDCLNFMLEAQRDYSVNPENIGGLTHFHIACRIFNARIVKKFLKYADIDINHSIDYFYDNENGSTALHLAATSVNDLDLVSRQLDTIDVLLEHGANVHVEDAEGETPLYNCVRFYLDSGTVDIFERIARAGADVNARNLDRYTPLYYYLDSNNITAEGIKTLLRIGCQLNVFTSTDYGYMGRMLRRLDTEKLLELFSIIAVNFRKEIAIDDTGRTAIHNIVSDEQVKISADEYASLIEIMSRAGFDVDCQDQLGRTALHMATMFHNVEGIAGLLMAGADLNITDSNGKTALAFDDTCTLCQSDDKDQSTSKDRMHKHLEVVETLYIHVKKLQWFGLDVDKQNEDYAYKIFEKFKSKITLPDRFFREFEAIETTIIHEDPQPLTLENFLSETDVITHYPRMSWLQRDAIKKFFSSSDVENFRKKYPELAGIGQLQYRKARARPQLLRLAGNALKDLTGFRLPDICSDCIFMLLRNSELNNLIASTV